MCSTRRTGDLAVKNHVICSLRRFQRNDTDGNTTKCVHIDAAQQWIVYAAAVELIDSASGNEDFLELMPDFGPLRLLYGNDITALMPQRESAEQVTLQRAIETAVAYSRNDAKTKSGIQFGQWTENRRAYSKEDGIGFRTGNCPVCGCKYYNCRQNRAKLSLLETEIENTRPGQNLVRPISNSTRRFSSAEPIVCLRGPG